MRNILRNILRSENNEKRFASEILSGESQVQLRERIYNRLHETGNSRRGMLQMPSVLHRRPKNLSARAAESRNLKRDIICDFSDTTPLTPQYLSTFWGNIILSRFFWF